MKSLQKFFLDKYYRNKLYELINSKLFWFGLVLKSVLSFLFASDFLTKLFIPFVSYFVSSGLKNPYAYFYNQGIINIFPYPSLMLYILSIPRVFGFFLNWNSISFFHIFLFKIPFLLADFIVLIVLIRLLRNHLKKILFYYWLSPVLIYINYVHGQADVIPISLLFISLYFLFKNKYCYSSLFLAFSIATKTNILLVVPFYFIYLLKSDVEIKKLFLHFTLILLIFVGINMPYIFYPSFFELVLNNKEQIKIFGLFYKFPNNKILYFTPIIYIILLSRSFTMKSISKDVYMMFLGFAFGIVTLLVPPMQGWYYWIIPFFTYFYIKNEEKNLGIFLLLLQLIYFLYFLFAENSDYLNIFQIISSNIANKSSLYDFLTKNGYSADKILGIVFSILQSLLIINCIIIYKKGVESYLCHKLFSKPFILGICGDSGAGKTTLSTAMEKIFQRKNVAVIHGDDMHKWERGDKNWEKFTHLNPKANLLHNEIEYLKFIKDDKQIYRRHYDHSTGKFTEKKSVKPRRLTIFEGLHSFYIQQMRDLYDLKIFVKPNDDLRKHWKIIRDKQKRGYSKEKVLEQLKSREKDSKKFINSQVSFADIVFELCPIKKIKNVGDPKEKIKTYLKITVINTVYLEPLIYELNKVSNLKIVHKYLDNDKQVLKIKGYISSKNIDIASYRLLKNFDDINIKPKWDSSYNGIAQLLVTYCIINNQAE